MSQDRRGGGRRSKLGRSGGGIAQLPWQSVKNPYPPMQLLNEERMDQLHKTSMRILSELGIRVMSEKVMDLFAKAGAIVDRESNTIRIDESIVTEALRNVPSSFTLTSRNPDKQVEFGGNSLVFGLVAGPPNVHDRINGRRPGNLPDYQNFIRLAHHFNAIHIIGNQVVAPIELPASSRHLDTYHANLTLSDLSFHCTAIGRARAMDGISMMAIARGISVEEMRASPGVTTIISINSPRLFDDAMAEGLIAMAEHGQPVTVTPFTLMGAMTPVTLAAALCQQNAEALFGVVLTQLVNPGTPVMYGAFTSNVDMKSGAPAFGTPENTKANIASGQLARRYNLPYRTTPGSASNAADAQGAYETMMALWGAVLGHGNLVYHAAGWQEGGLTASFEKLIIDVEMIQHMMEFLRPIVVDEAELAVEALGAVPTGGHFFGEPHTLERYATAFYQPMLSNWQNYEAWQEAGGLDTTARATRLWKKALEEYVQPAMDPAVREALEAYMARRKEAIGPGEP